MVDACHLASHLDTRVISCAELWLERRAELGQPLGVAQSHQLQSPGKPQSIGTDEPADLLIEIGCEELPPADVQAAERQLRCLACSILSSSSCAFCSWSQSDSLYWPKPGRHERRNMSSPLSRYVACLAMPYMCWGYLRQ